MGQGATIRRFRPEDRDAAVDLLLSKVDPATRPAVREQRLARWRWQYDENPANPEGVPILWVAEAAGEVVGLVCPLAAKLRTPAGLVGASWCNDWIVDRSQRGTGLGWALEEAWVKTFPVALGRGWSERAYAVSVKLGLVTVSGFGRAWVVVSRPAFASLLLRTRQYRRLRGLLLLPPKLRLRARRAAVAMDVLPDLPPDAGALWDRVAPKYGFSVERTQEHLEWRYSRQPTQRYKFIKAAASGATVGLAVVRVSADRPAVGVICDLLADPGDHALVLSLLDRAVTELKAAGACAVVADYPPALAYAFEGLGRPALLEEVKILVSDNLKAHEQAGIYDSRSWYLSKSDSDIDFSDSLME